MRTLEQRLSYEHLELISTSKPTVSDSLSHRIASLGSQLVKGMARLFLGSNEPQIWTHADKTGQQVWYVRDPHTQEVSCLSSEHEVRVWLDNRSYS